MNIRSTSPNRAPMMKAQTPPVQGQQGQEPPKDQAPMGDAFARNTSNAITEYGVYSLAAGGATLGMKGGGYVGLSIGVAIGAAFGSGAAMVNGGFIGTVIGGAAGLGLGGYGGMKLGAKVLDAAGSFGEKTLSSSPNVGKATAQALTLGVLSGVASSSPLTGISAVGLTAAVGAYDTYMGK